MQSPDSHPGAVSTALSRELGLLHVTMMGVGMMIGAGVFIGVGNAVRVAGPGGVLLTFALNGVIALFTAMSYAELSSAIPRAGGTYNFARIAFGRGTSFLAGWMEWFACSVAGSLYAVTFALYTVHYLDQLQFLPPGLLGWPGIEKLVAVGIAGAFVYVNYRGTSQTGTIGALFALGQTLTLAFIAATGVVVAVRDPSRLANFQPFLPQGWSQLLATMGFTYVAFEGFEVIAQAGEETIEPRRNLPKAMIYSILIVVAAYLGVSFAALIGVKDVGEPPWMWIGSFGGKGFGEAVSRLLPFGGFLTTIAVIFASTSALNATIYSAARTSYALGRDHMLPSLFARISPIRHTPHLALLLTACLVLGVAAFLPTLEVASSASMMFLLLFFVANVCVIRIRNRMQDELVYGFRMPLFPFLPLAAILAQGTLIIWLMHLSRLAWAVGTVWIGVGVLLYYAYARHRTTSTEEEVVTLEEEPVPSRGRYRILVSVADPSNAIELAWHCHRLSQVKHAEVQVIHMVPVPPQLALSDASTYLFTGEEAITEAMLYLSADFPFGSTVRYCRNIARGITSTARQQRADMLVLGWAGFKRRGFALGSTVDPVLKQAPCDAAVLKNCHHRRYQRVLVPVAGGPNSALALELASIFAESGGGGVTLLHVRSSGKPGIDLDQFLRKHLGRLTLEESRFRSKYCDSPTVLAGLLEEARHYDLIVLGASQEGLFHQTVMGRLPEQFARDCDQPLIMVKAAQRVKSMLRRLV